jgi:hypothetical protein
MLNWVMRHIKLVVAIVLSLVVVVVCYVAVQQGVIDDDSPIREVPFNK